MPKREVCSCTTTTYTILCTTSYSCFKLLRKSDSCMCYFSTSNFCVDASLRPALGSDTCSLRCVPTSRHIAWGYYQVSSLSTSTRQTVDGRSTPAMTAWDINFKKRDRIVVSPYIIHSIFFWIVCKQCCRNHHVHKLRSLKYFA